MKEEQMKALWHNQTTPQMALFNPQVQSDNRQMHLIQSLRGMRPVKWFALFSGVLWVLLLGACLTHLALNAWASVSRYFFFSALLQGTLTLAALLLYGYQLKLLYDTDWTEAVLLTQRRLARLRVSTLTIMRILILQLPLWTTFYLSDTLLAQAPWYWLCFQGFATLGSTALAGWLFFQLRYENRHRTVFRWLFSGPEWAPLIQAIDLLEDIQLLEKA